MTAIDATCQGDVRKLSRFFETLAASSDGPYPYTPLIPVDFNGAPVFISPLSGPYNEGYHVNSKQTGPYTPLCPVDFNGAPVFIRPLSGPYNEDYHVNSKQKFRGSVVGGDAPWFTSLSRPFNHVNFKQTAAAYTPVDFKGSVAGEDVRPCVPCNECSKEHPPYSACPYLPCRVCYKVHYPGSCPYFNYLPQGATFNPCYEIVCACGNEFNEEKWVCTCCDVGRPVLTLKHCGICNSSKDHSSHDCPNDKVRAAEYKLNRDLLLAVGARTIPYHQVYIPE